LPHSEQSSNRLQSRSRRAISRAIPKTLHGKLIELDQTPVLGMGQDVEIKREAIQLAGSSIGRRSPSHGEMASIAEPERPCGGPAMNYLLKSLRRSVHFPVLLAVAMAPHDAAIAAENAGEARAIRQINRLGGEVERNDKLPGRPATAVSLRGAGRFEDLDVPLLKPLSNLTTLDLSGTKICGTHIIGGGLRELQKLKSLSFLDLSYTQITDAGLNELREFKSLTRLNLNGTGVCGRDITGGGLKELKHLTRLELDGTEITDRGLKQLRELKNLTTLSLKHTAITGTGMNELRELKNLNTLNLYAAQITDAGLREIRQLKNLRTLDLHGTQITDFGLQELRELKNLRTLLVYQTNITDAGVKKLREFLPDLGIYK
jgi:internalin A